MARIKRILLVDSSAVLYAAKFGAPKNLKTKEKSTFVIFGFLMKLRYLMNRTYADVVVFAGDSKREDSLRKSRYPSYKEGRDSNKTPEEIALDKIAMPQFIEVLDTTLPMLGYKNIFSFKGYEADDVIGVICKKYKNIDIIIVTSDKDMWQLLTDNICIMHPSTYKYFTKKDFITKYGMEPKMWKRIKAIAGCDSDKVKGVFGVGEKTVWRFLKNELPHHHKTYQNITSREGKDIINRNKALVILPYRGTPDCIIQRDEVTKKNIKKMANFYAFKSIKSDIANWTKTLRAWG